MARPRSQTSGAARERQRREDELMAELEQIVPLPNDHRCDDPDCSCWHEGRCCGQCSPF